MSWLLADPDRVPGRDLDPEAVERSATEARTFSEKIGDQGAAVRDSWRSLGDSYQDPSTPDLLTKMDPVAMRTAAMAADLGKVAAALGTLAEEQRSIKHDRAALITAITDFRSRVTTEISGLGGTIADIGLSLTLPDRWDRENTALIHRSRTLDARITEAEQACARAIRDTGGVTRDRNPLADLWNTTTTSIGNTVNHVSDEVLEFWNGTKQTTTTAWDNTTQTLTTAWDDTTQTVTTAWDNTTNWFDDRLDDARDGAEDGIEWVTQTATGFGHWWTERVTTIGDDWANVGDASSQWWDAAAAGGDARTTEVSASTIRWIGSLNGAVGTTLTAGTIPMNVFDDGEPWCMTVRDEVPQVDDDSGTPELTIPRDLYGITQGMVDAYGAGDGIVRFTTINGPQGPRVIVTVPGTDPSLLGWSPHAGPSLPNDLTGNLVTAGGGESTMTKAVRMAMEQADIPDGAEVMIVGHSQGGMTAAKLTSDPEFVERFNVTNLMTMGSPIENDSIDPRVNIEEVKHERDIVSKLDLGGQRLWTQASPEKRENHTTITLDDPAAPYDVYNNHIPERYAESIHGSNDPVLAAAERRLRREGFILSQGLESSAGGVDDRVSGKDIKIGRTD